MRQPLSSSQRPTVLVVDDLAVNRKVLKRMAQRLGFSVLEASDGLECLDKVAWASSTSHHLACILMDLKMPKLNGWEASQHLRALEAQQWRSGSGGAQNTLDMPGSTNSNYDKPALTDSRCSTLFKSQQEADIALCSKHPRRIPIIACTATKPDERIQVKPANAPGSTASPFAWPTATLVETALAAGMDQVLEKPVRLTALESALDEWVPSWRTLVAAASQPAVINSCRLSPLERTGSMGPPPAVA